MVFSFEEDFFPVSWGAVLLFGVCVSLLVICGFLGNFAFCVCGFLGQMSCFCLSGFVKSASGDGKVPLPVWGGAFLWRLAL